MINKRHFKRKVTRCLEDGEHFFTDQVEQEEMICVMNHFIDTCYEGFIKSEVGIDDFKKYYLDHFTEYFKKEDVQATINELIEEEKYKERENEDK